MFTKTKIIIISAISVIIAVSCSLEENIYDTPMADSFIKSEADVAFLVNGIYAPLIGFNCYKTTAGYLQFYTDDNLAITNATYQLYAKRTIAPSHTYFQPTWGSFYTVIKNANIVLDMVEKEEVLSEDFRKRIVGEIRYMRAFVYFELVRLFGKVPLLTEPVTGNSDFYPERKNIEEVYSQIFTDFEAAIQTCIPYSQQPVEEGGRATKGAALGMYALANLTYANYLELNNKSSEAMPYYQKAAAYADSVILSNEYSLIPNYSDLFDAGKESAAYQEVIFGIQFTRDTKAASASSKGSEWAYYMQPSSRYNICGNVTNGQGAAQSRVQPWFYDLCTTGDYTGDYRSEFNFLTRWKYQNSENYTVTYPRIPNTAAGDRSSPEQYPYMDKYKDPNGLQARNNENDWFYLRLAEIYLIKAEALNELNNGPVPEAYEAFNKVRERARNADGAVRTTPSDLTGPHTKEEFRMKIFDERGLELFAEGHRFYDNVRMRYIDNKRTMMEYRYDDFYENMSADIKKAPAYSSSTKTWGTGRVYVNSVVPWTTKFLIWPIASPEIDRNPNITQNTEYGW
ncbi:MAG: RagB/SusD family nutrient uptake outer membrane protein [Tannerella sp.]|jgi:hypothetical protein|nr:RagB/SusD family nutrient uptake outer membrane protein [Tannerella sp.]